MGQKTVTLGRTGRLTSRSQGKDRRASCPNIDPARNAEMGHEDRVTSGSDTAPRQPPTHIEDRVRPECADAGVCRDKDWGDRCGLYAPGRWWRLP